MASELVNFFKSLIGTPDPLVKGCSVEWLKSLLDYSLPDGADVFLVGEITDKEIKEALFRQGKDKSPGPDGYTSWFFKGRDIAENTLLAQEIVRGYSRKNLSPRCALKINLQKAFDSVCWDFLLNVLEALGLPAIFCGWIKTCVTTHRYSISFNVLLNVAARDGVFRFHPKCKKICLTHLCFVNDLLLFCHGSLDSVMGVVSILDRFYELSGLRLNAMKSEFFACGVSVNSLLQIRLATGFNISQLPVRYLGVPLVTRKLTSRDCLALLNKIKSIIDVWSSRHLSLGGRLQLVKCVLFSIFGYWSRQLVLPKGVIKDIKKLCMRFFWKGNDIPANGARVSWSQICCLKSECGMGLRKLTDWSKAFCFMFVRKILVDDGSLWIAWIKGYCFKTMDYWNVDCKNHFSWILRKLLKLRDEARRLFWPAINLTYIKGGWIWDSVRERRDKAANKGQIGMVTDNVCGLCGAGQESRNHLFLECSYATEVWGAILRACGLQL
ncbi:uncharacterized protein LOC120132937 [Hibiscus syriacus]|uniref:uncharacterized protein LOC120132937 n=1 Tax=Hibiscus syriacus TaxID=106335 RepID=UPI0019213D5C|nr:uncharacterized protein LOC120132937 [Hibiscus syriacus]